MSFGAETNAGPTEYWAAAGLGSRRRRVDLGQPPALGFVDGEFHEPRGTPAHDDAKPPADPTCPEAGPDLSRGSGRESQSGCREEFGCSLGD